MAEKQIGIYSITCTVNGKLDEGNTLPLEIRQQISKSVREVWEAKSGEEKKSIVENQLTWRFEKGHDVPAYVREKLRQANLGKKQSAETISKRSKSMKAAMLGNRNGNKPVYCEETGSTYESAKTAASILGVSVTGISHALKGRQKTAGGYHFQYSSREEI